MLIVLAIPKRNGGGDQVRRAGLHHGDLRRLRWSPWAIYLGDEAASAVAPDAGRREHAPGRAGQRAARRSPTSRSGQDDLVVRRPWIPYFNIQYYLGLDGISLSLVVLTGLVSVLACLASWNIDEAGQGLLRPLPAADGQHDGRVPLARPVPVLRVLRGDAAADVLPDRHLGRRRGASTPRSSSCCTRSSARSSSWWRS